MKLGFRLDEIQMIKNSIQQFSEVARVMIVPLDNLYKDLKIDAIAGEDDDMMELISSKLQLTAYEEGKLIDNDVSSVIELFDFIKSKR